MLHTLPASLTRMPSMCMPCESPDEAARNVISRLGLAVNAGRAVAAPTPGSVSKKYSAATMLLCA